MSDRQLDDIGLVKEIHSRGFGFARNLTGVDAGDVFLNQGRIRDLGLGGGDFEPVLIRMSVVNLDSGKLAASRVKLLSLDDDGVDDLLWSHVARLRLKVASAEKLRKLHKGLPGILPFIILFADSLPEAKAVLREMAPEISFDLWNQPALLPALWLVPPDLRRLVVARHIEHRPVSTWPVLHKVLNDDGWGCDESWLAELWDTVPSSRELMLDLVRQHWSKGLLGRWDVVEWIDRAIAVGQEASFFWSELAAYVQNGFVSYNNTWHHNNISDDWPALAAAPWNVIELIAGQQFPQLAVLMASIRQLETEKAERVGFNAKELLDGLDETDRELAESWVPAAGQRNVEAVRAQMQTARAAEKCAMRYLQNLGLEVDDVAITQLTGVDDAWRVMDLRVERSHGVDVKNLRRMLHGGMHSSKWKAKYFKNDAKGSDVLLCGVSSPYTKLEGNELSCKDDEAMVVLGVTSAGEAEKLFGDFSQVYAFHVNQVSNLLELPVWAWDYPSAHYLARDAAMAGLREVVSDLSGSNLGKRCLEAMPPILLSIMGVQPLVGKEVTGQQCSRFLELLRGFALDPSSSIGRSKGVPRLPWFYLFVLHFWAYWRANNETSNISDIRGLFSWKLPSMNQWSPVSLKRASSGWHSPLLREELSRHSFMSVAGSAKHGVLGVQIGILDVSGSLSVLIDALSSIETHISRSEFLRISDITVYGNGVLAGLFPDGIRRTLLAHCGGQDQLMNNADCGFRPLVYGLHKTCACGRLICPKCECCGDGRYSNCEHQFVRQEKRAKSKPGWR
ncbi:hypothetical protein [Rhodanobacter thiooxydans]|uniref:hypothetical protein n=1 Tax=Rhodanobacter thiooxydans TaxID=416169 RepID=UPI00131F38B7|nr:hypothetical protein [Rhodanobacter thiooxydans]